MAWISDVASVWKSSDDRIGLLAQRAGRDRGFDGTERIVDRVHEHPALRVDHQHAMPVAALDRGWRRGPACPAARLIGRSSVGSRAM